MESDGNLDNLVYYGKPIRRNMKIILILMFGLLLTNCSNNKKVIKSPDDLRNFVNVFCEKHKSDDKVIKVEHPLNLDARSQLLASILAKKASVSATHVLVDIPIGKGAKIEIRKRAITHTDLFLNHSFIAFLTVLGIPYN